MSVIIAVAAVAGLAAGARAECVPLVEAAKNNGLTTLVKAISDIKDLPSAAALYETVTRTEPVAEADRVTTCGPTDPAFAAVAGTTSEYTLEDSAEMLLNHIVPADLPSTVVVSELGKAGPDGVTLDTLANQALKFTQEDDGGIFVKAAGAEKPAEIIDVDIETCVGYMHVVDQVLLPSLDEEADVVEEPVDDGAEEPVEEPVDDDAEDDGAEEPVEEPVDDDAEEPAEDPVDDDAEEPAEMPVDDDAEEPAEAPVDIGEEPVPGPVVDVPDAPVDIGVYGDDVAGVYGA